MTDLLRLYPDPGGRAALNGLYLDGPLEPPGFGKALFLYSNFVLSLDGRIAVAPAGELRQGVPGTTANPRDWRLFQELVGRADVLITSGRYMRELAAGRARELQPVAGGEAFEDIRQWRADRGLPPQADVAVISRSLDFRVPPVLRRQGLRVIILTAESAPPDRVLDREREGAQVIPAGADTVDGSLACDRLAEAGYGRACNVTGARVLHTLLRAGQVHALFLTSVHRLIAGEPFTSLVQGPALPRPADFRLVSLYYDAAALDGVGQTFARYDCIAPGR